MPPASLNPSVLVVVPTEKAKRGVAEKRRVYRTPRIDFSLPLIAAKVACRVHRQNAQGFATSQPEFAAGELLSRSMASYPTLYPTFERWNSWC